jgi:formylglycine-generating enzyme required for sulfatase activity
MTDGAIEQESTIMATWIDPETGLEWQCDSPDPMNWHAAQAYADSLSINGKNDWRLPTASELETLLDRTQYRPVMREEIPFRDTLSYWSSTTFGPAKNNAWIVMFDGAYVLSYYKTNKYHVRCVRG